MPTREARRRRRLIGAGVGVLAGLLLVGMLWTIAQLGNVIVQIEAQQQSNASTLQLIRDCTTDGGACYEDSERRTANVIRVLNEAGRARRDYIIAVVVCADRPGIQTVAAIKSCANREVNR